MEPTGPTPAELAAQRRRQEQLAAQRRREEAAAREKARREAILAAGARDRARLLAARRERERLAREAAAKATANTTSTGTNAEVPQTSGNPGVGTIALTLGLIAACLAALFGGRLFARRHGGAPAPYRALAQRVPDGVKRVIAVAEGELLLAGAAVGATLLVIVIWVVTI